METTELLERALAHMIELVRKGVPHAEAHRQACEAYQLTGYEPQALNVAYDESQLNHGRQS